MHVAEVFRPYFHRSTLRCLRLGLRGTWQPPSTAMAAGVAPIHAPVSTDLMRSPASHGDELACNLGVALLGDMQRVSATVNIVAASIGRGFKVRRADHCRDRMYPQQLTTPH